MAPRVGGGVSVGVGVCDGEVYERGRLDSSSVSVGLRVVGVNVGLAVAIAVEEGVTVGVWEDVAVTKTVGVAVAVEALPALMLPVINKTTTTRDTRLTAAKTVPSRRSIRSPAVPTHGSNTVIAGGLAGEIVSISEDTVLSASTTDGNGPNSASFISAMP